MFFSPLESFELVLHRPPFTNGSLFLLATGLLLAALAATQTARPTLVPGRWQWLLEQLYRFILTMVREQTGSAALGFFPLFLLSFALVAAANLVGLLPFAFTVTAQLAVTFALALSFNVAFAVLGFALHGFAFLRLFLPAGAPTLLLPLIALIELVSYLIRTFSLAIRLFANMMAGHTLLHILATFTLQLLAGPVAPLALLPLLLVLGVFLLEFAIALIQAYVFTILLCIYANDSYHPGH